MEQHISQSKRKIASLLPHVGVHTNVTNARWVVRKFKAVKSRRLRHSTVDDDILVGHELTNQIRRCGECPFVRGLHRFWVLSECLKEDSFQFRLCSFVCLTPSLSQLVKFHRWKVHPYTPANSIFSGTVTNLLSKHFDRKPFTSSCQRKKGLIDFKFCTFTGRFQSDAAANIAVKGLNQSVLLYSKQNRKGQRPNPDPCGWTCGTVCGVNWSPCGGLPTSATRLTI